MSYLFDKLEHLSERTMKTLQRYPMASFSAFIVTLVLINLVELHNYPKDNVIIITLTKIAFVASLGVVLFPALRLLKPHWLMILLGIGLLGGYYYILPSDIAASESNIFVRHLFLMVAFFIMLMWAPFAFLRISNQNIWEWTQNLIVALVSALFFSLILFGGLSLALFAISRLFEITISSERYLQLAIAIFGLYGVNIFLSQVPKYVLLLQTKTYSKAEIIFTKYILTPLAFGYFLILYAYTAKVLFTMQWPKGMLAWIIVLFSLVAIITYLFWTPLSKESNQPYRRYVWLAILFQTVMLGVAIWMRIEVYGITESRYFVALFGLWLVLISFYFIMIKNANYKWLFLSLSLLLIGSQFGQYSAAEVSQRSQLQRLSNIMTAAEPLSEATDLKERYEISNIIAYLYNYYGVESLATTLPETVEAYQEQNKSTQSYFPHFATEQLGFTYVDRYAYQFGASNTEQSFYTNRESMNIEGYQWLQKFYYYPTDHHGMPTEQHSSGRFTLSMEQNILSIKKGGHTYTLDLTPLVEKLNEIDAEGRVQSGSVDPAKMEQVYEEDTLKVKVLVEHVLVSQENAISSLSMSVLIGEK